MNSKKVKELKKIINFQKGDPSQKRLFNRLKKQYSKLSKDARPIFLDKLNETYNNI